jgi:hypothetical protein
LTCISMIGHFASRVFSEIALFMAIRASFGNVESPLFQLWLKSQFAKFKLQCPHATFATEDVTGHLKIWIIFSPHRNLAKEMPNGHNWAPQKIYITSQTPYWIKLEKELYSQKEEFFCAIQKNLASTVRGWAMKDIPSKSMQYSRSKMTQNNPSLKCLKISIAENIIKLG